jgi:hypothetical protein
MTCNPVSGWVHQSPSSRHACLLRGFSPFHTLKRVADFSASSRRAMGPVPRVWCRAQSGEYELASCIPCTSFECGVLGSGHLRISVGREAVNIWIPIGAPIRSSAEGLISPLQPPPGHPEFWAIFFLRRPAPREPVKRRAGSPRTSSPTGLPRRRPAVAGPRVRARSAEARAACRAPAAHSLARRAAALLVRQHPGAAGHAGRHVDPQLPCCEGAPDEGGGRAAQARPRDARALHVHHRSVFPPPPPSLLLLLLLLPSPPPATPAAACALTPPPRAPQSCRAPRAESSTWASSPRAQTSQSSWPRSCCSTARPTATSRPRCARSPRRLPPASPAPLPRSSLHPLALSPFTLSPSRPLALSPPRAEQHAVRLLESLAREHCVPPAAVRQLWETGATPPPPPPDKKAPALPPVQSGHVSSIPPY